MHILDRYDLRHAHPLTIEQMARSLRREADLLDVMADRISRQGE